MGPTASHFLCADEQKHLQSAISYISRQFIGVQREMADIYPSLNKLIIHGSFGRSALI